MIQVKFWFIKLISFLLGVSVVVLYVVPQELVANTDAVRYDHESTDPFNVVRVAIKPFSLICVSKTFDGNRVDVKSLFAALRLKEFYVNLSQPLAKVAKCYSLLRQASVEVGRQNSSPLPSKDDCLCLNSYYLAITLACSGAFVFQCALIMVVVCSTHIEPSGVSRVQGCAMSCIAMCNSLAWLANGALQVMFLFVVWPYSIEIRNAKTNYYKPPYLWIIAMGFCFGGVLSNFIESMVWMCFTEKKHKFRKQISISDDFAR